MYQETFIIGPLGALFQFYFIRLIKHWTVFKKMLSILFFIVLDIT